MIDKKNKKRFLQAIIILGIIGIFISLYLLQNHYAPPAQGALCDFGESISCSLVNTSVFSELFHVPVALFGALWLFILIVLGWKAMKKDGTLITLMLAWNILGLLFVVYLVIAEIILQSICPFCTVVHLIVIATLIISIILFKQEPKAAQKHVREATGKWLVGVIILFAIPLIAFNIPSSDKTNYDALAKCMTEKGMVMYGSFRCGVCAKTRAMFGDSFQYIREIECHPQGKNSQTDLCIQKSIQGTPTWALEPGGVEVKRYTGFLSADELKTFSGCP